MAYDFNSLIKQADEASNRDKFYTDFEDVDPNVLHQISELTDWMRTKAKGSDVREVIAQLFERTWVESIKEGNANLEVAQARGTYPNLRSRLDEVDSKQNQTTVQLAQKADKDEVTNVMTPKGALAYASLPTSGNQVGWYYYCPDGDGTHGAGNYVWNGKSWFFGGTGDEGYNLLKKDLTEYGDLLKNVDDKATTMITTIDLDKTNWSNGYINTDGKITHPSDTNWKHTDFINVMLLRGLNITYHLETYDLVNGISFYDENKTYISGSTSASTRTVEIPSNAYYVRFSCSSEQLTLNSIYVKMPLKRGISDLNLSNNVRLVMIGDSYGIKNTDGDITKFYWEYVKDALGLIENVDFFQKFAEGHGFGSGGYLANLKSLNITDKNKITDIFVCGGWNDCDKSQSYGTDEAFESGILEFNNYVKANFPNATISVAHISWGLFGDNAFYQKMNTSLTRYIYACNKFGWRFISNVEYILRKNDSTLWASDMAHPSNKGQKLLGENLTSPFLSGSADTSYIFNSNTVIIRDKKIMLNSDNSISWSNIN